MHAEVDLGNGVLNQVLTFVPLLRAESHLSWAIMSESKWCFWSATRRPWKQMSTRKQCISSLKYLSSLYTARDRVLSIQLDQQLLNLVLLISIIPAVTKEDNSRYRESVRLTLTAKI
jgi:hypothetical protein